MSEEQRVKNSLVLLNLNQVEKCGFGPLTPNWNLP